MSECHSCWGLTNLIITDLTVNPPDPPNTNSAPDLPDRLWRSPAGNQLAVWYRDRVVAARETTSDPLLGVYILPEKLMVFPQCLRCFPRETYGAKQGIFKKSWSKMVCVVMCVCVGRLETLQSQCRCFVPCVSLLKSLTHSHTTRRCYPWCWITVVEWERATVGNFCITSWRKSDDQSCFSTNYYYHFLVWMAFIAKCIAPLYNEQLITLHMHT